MVIVEFDSTFEKLIKKLKDAEEISKIKKQISKIIENPEVGKPMRYGQKGTREVYIKPFRLSYFWIKEESKIILLDLYHKDKQ